MIRRATTLLSFCLATALSAQPQRIVTAADYAHAERFLAQTTSPLVFGAGVRPTWLSGDRFWYRTTKPNGVEFVLVDPATGSRSRAFDQAKLAAGLTAATGTAVDSMHLPFTLFEYAPDGRAIRVRVGGRGYECDPATGRCGAAMDDR
ncbi:MAG: S9 family peptidase, partial [Gemmatimonadota bacterium]|nr:S9 family peptidase [Gemmatimonadota bacterium]